MESQYEWVVGLSGRSEDRGALELVKWLSDAAGRADWSIRGVHILPRRSVLRRLRRLSVSRSHLSSRTRVAAEIADARAAQSLASVDILPAETVDGGLLGSLSPRSLGLVIGRAAGADEHALVKLGSVARRLLRRAHVPVVVVPPDFDPALVSVGPIIVATDLSERSAGAALFARWFGELLGRPLVLAHVGRPRPSPKLDLMTRSDIERLLQEEQRRASIDLQSWAERHGLSNRQQVVRVGPPTSELLHVAAQTHATALVCGPRQLTLRQRLVQRSTSSNLAAASRIPVIAIPSSDGQRPWTGSATPHSWQAGASWSDS